MILLLCWKLSASHLLCLWFDREMAELEVYFFWEALEGGSAWDALLGGLEAADDVLECGRHDKVLLLQSELFSFEELRNTETAETEETLI